MPLPWSLSSRAAYRPLWLGTLTVSLAMPACSERAEPPAPGSSPGTSAAAEPSISASGAGPSGAEPPATAGQPGPDISALSSWCTSCAEGGDTTDFGSFPFCGYRYEMTSVEDARARGYELPARFRDIEQEFVAPFHWREQARDTELTVRIEITRAQIAVPPNDLDGGTLGEDCGQPTLMNPWLRVTLAAADGSINGWFESFGNLPPQGLRGKLAFGMNWNDVVLSGNLPLVVNPAHMPTYVDLYFVWHQVDESPTNRVGIQISSAYDSSDGSACRTRLCFDTHAIGLPLDNCSPHQLPLNGVCTDLRDHPDYRVPTPPPDALDDAGVPSDPISDAGIQ